jgi:hypothetical protein
MLNSKKIIAAVVAVSIVGATFAINVSANRFKEKTETTIGDSKENDERFIQPLIVGSANVATSVQLDAGKSKSWSFDLIHLFGGDENDDNTVNITISNQTNSKSQFEVTFIDTTSKQIIVDALPTGSYSNMFTGLNSKDKYSVTLVNKDSGTVNQTYKVSISSSRS